MSSIVPLVPPPYLFNMYNFTPTSAHIPTRMRLSSVSYQHVGPPSQPASSTCSPSAEACCSKQTAMRSPPSPLISPLNTLANCPRAPAPVKLEPAAHNCGLRCTTVELEPVVPFPFRLQLTSLERGGPNAAEHRTF